MTDTARPLSGFDSSAIEYCASIPRLPNRYVLLIQEVARLSTHDKVIDLGCGSGELAIALSQFSSDVTGIDASQEMIRLARLRGATAQVRWMHCPVQSFDFGCSCCKLVTSLEAFHLFPDPGRLVQRLERALVQGGTLAIGWTDYQWQAPLKSVIIEVFTAYGVDWEDWGYWRCPELPTIVAKHASDLLPLRRTGIKVKSKTHVAEIATLLASINKAASLDTEAKRHLRKELELRFEMALGSEWSSAFSCFSLAYCVKHGS